MRRYIGLQTKRRWLTACKFADFKWLRHVQQIQDWQDWLEEPETQPAGSAVACFPPPSSLCQLNTLEVVGSIFHLHVLYQRHFALVFSGRRLSHVEISLAGHTRMRANYLETLLIQHFASLLKFNMSNCRVQRLALLAFRLNINSYKCECMIIRSC
jgi:hypothetical protein